MTQWMQAESDRQTLKVTPDGTQVTFPTGLKLMQNPPVSYLIAI
tara:strand:+ start:33 stop:164 length:132 start_codon:yes stop_codon:yes gene_type:complete